MNNSLNDFYDEEYFDGGKGYHSYNYSGQYDFWADNIVRLFQPDSVLDVGCAKGFLVKALRDRGVAAFGVDVSEYAIAHADEDIADYLFNYDIMSGKEVVFPKTDMIVCTDTLEHIPEKDLDKVFEFFERTAPSYFIRVATTNTPNWDHDKSHVTIHTLDWWQRRFPDAVWEESI